MRKAVVILGSQKTLPVSMAVLASLPEELGEKGTIAVPCILGHLSQLLIDSYVATKWSEIEELKETEETEEAKEPEVDPEAPKSDDNPSTASTASNVEATAQGERI